MAESILENLTASNIFDLRGVIAVVTGGGTGIGQMISSTLLANGAKVYVIGPNQTDLDLVTKTFNEVAKKSPNRGTMIGIAGDIRRKAEAKRIAEVVGKQEKNGITVLFNNAGILAGNLSFPSEPTAAAYVKTHFDGVSEHDFEDVLATNAVGPYWLTFAFLPLLEKWKFSAAENLVAKKFAPQIVMTSSMNGWTKDLNTGGRSYPYLFSKSAIGHATSSLANDLLPLGIRVNGIAPGWFPTPMGAPGGTTDEHGVYHPPADVKLTFEVPLQRETGGTNRDMGTLALFLVANWYVSGETVLIDGGTLLRHPSSY